MKYLNISPISGTISDFLITTVNGPGQNSLVNLSAVFEISFANLNKSSLLEI